MALARQQQEEAKRREQDAARQQELARQRQQQQEALRRLQQQQQLAQMKVTNSIRQHLKTPQQLGTIYCTITDGGELIVTNGMLFFMYRFDNIAILFLR